MENISKNQNFLGINKNSIERLIVDKEEAEKAYKALENYKANKIKDSYDFFNKISKGNGSRAYNKFTYDKLSHSLEYTTAFQYLHDKKKFNLDTKEGEELHFYRNKNQYNKAPKDLQTMINFVKAGYFIFEGFSPCHNLKKGSNDYKSRKATLSTTIYLVRSKKLYSPNQYSPMYNISFRGTLGTSFEGCQFIYNHTTGKLVTDNINRGTWDYGKYATLMHYILDIDPWLRFGNGDNIETPDLFIMDETQEKLYMEPGAINKAKEMKKKSSIFMSDKSILAEFNQFLKWDKENSENLAYTLSGDREKELITSKLAKSKEEFIDEEYVKNAEKRFDNDSVSNIDEAYKDAWFDYVSFLTYLENREFLSDKNNIIQYANTNPISLREIISDSREKEKYGETMFKSAFSNLKPEERVEGTKVSTDVPIKLELVFTQDVKDAVQDVKNKLGDEEGRNQALFYINSIVVALNEKIKRFNFEVVQNPQNDPLEAIFSSFSVTFKQFRMVSKIESIILSNQVLSKNAKRFISNNEPINNPDSSESNESLVNPCQPEYLDYSCEDFAYGTLALAAIIATLLVGTGKIIYDKVTKDRIDKIAKRLSKELSKLFSDEYDKLKIIDKNIKDRILKSKLVESIAEYDKYGVYNVYEPIDMITKVDYIKNRTNTLLLHAKEAKNYSEFLQLAKNDKFNQKVVDGYMYKEVFEDVSLLDELVKFEYGVNNTDQVTRINYIQSIVEEITDKLLGCIEPLITKEPGVTSEFRRDDVAIDWNKIGKNLIKNQLKFVLAYETRIETDYDSIQENIEKLIEKL